MRKEMEDGTFWAIVEADMKFIDPSKWGGTSNQRESSPGLHRYGGMASEKI